MNNVYNDSVLLIGGMAIGKTTVSDLLGEKLNMKVYSIDAIKHEVLENVPKYSFEKQLDIRKEKGFKGELEFLIPYVNLTTNQVIDNLDKPAIIDLSSIFENQFDDDLVSKIKKFKNIIYLYSNNNNDILKRRNIDPNSELGKIYLESLQSNEYDKLCTLKICVDNKTPEEIINEIMKSI